MASQPISQECPDPQDFTQQAQHTRTSFLGELWIFLRYNKRWWLTPIILVLVLVGFLLMLAGTAAAPFIYTLF
jgi:hypothetical protein